MAEDEDDDDLDWGAALDEAEEGGIAGGDGDDEGMDAGADEEEEEPEIVDPRFVVPKNGSRRVVLDVDLESVAVLGRTNMQMSQILKLGRGAVVELDRTIDEPIELVVNDIIVAKGEVMVKNEMLQLNITKIVKTDSGKI